MPFQIQKQIEDKWCWAAVSVSVDQYFSPGSTSTQCQVAHDVLPGSPVCCPHVKACNQGAALDTALKVVGRFSQIINGPVSFDQVRKQLSAGFPVGARVAWYKGGAHFVVISGCSVAPSGLGVLSIADPLFPDSTVYYDDFLSAYQAKTNGGGQWTHTYYTEL